ncbi:MAG: reverse transcriptase domain-containing protein, partial [Oscillospiraceae bacterium]|nr:reverse transcriptase domain-containing protein [Oscillospiraceae bacterium]
DLRRDYEETWDYEKIRKDVAQKIMQESIERRAARKKEREEERLRKSEAWEKNKEENIVFIGRGYSGGLSDKKTDEEKLISLNLPVIKDDKELANLLGIEYKDLRFLCYHRDVVVCDHYHRYTVPKRNGKERNIAAPKPLLKDVQRKILELILEKVEISDSSFGFLKGKSVVSNADSHSRSPGLLINMDLENFFPTVTFKRVRGMFKSFGYSGYVSSLLAMICTYCERMAIEVKGQTKYVKTSDRILPQGAPSSPMITNIICRNLDKRIGDLAGNHNFQYSRYADDMSFSFQNNVEQNEIRKIIYSISSVVYNEGFKINRDKTRYLKPNNRQNITGIVINNEEIGVPKTWIKRMRAAIYNAKKLKEKDELSEAKIREILGMASWLKSVNNARYDKIIKDAETLKDSLSYNLGKDTLLKDELVHPTERGINADSFIEELRRDDRI